MLSKWQTFFLLIMTLPIMGHVVILPLMLDVAGRDALLSIFISLPVALLFAYAIFRVRTNYPNETITEVLFLLLGKWGAKVVSLIFILYFLFLTILSLASLIDFVYIGFLLDTPQLALILWFMVFFLYAAAKGIKRIALAAGVLTFITLLTGNAVTIMDSKLKDWGEIFPFFEFGWSPILWGSLILMSVWMELLLLLCVPIKNIHEKRFYLLWVIGILLNVLMMLSTTSGVITIFGLGQAKNFLYPAQEIVRITSLGFIERFDIYGMILMTFGTYIRCSLYFRIAYELSMPSNTTKWIKGMLFSTIGVLTFFGTLYLVKNTFRIEEAINIYAYMIILFPIPFILWFISSLRKGKQTDRGL